MKSRKITFSIIVAVAFVTALTVVPAGAVPRFASGPVNRLISSSGTANMRAGAPGSDAIQAPEFRSGPGDEGGHLNQPRSLSALSKAKPQAADRSMSHSARAQSLRAANALQALSAPVVKPSKIVGDNPDLQTSFNGLNHRDQRTANGGKQFSLEPPDQGMCVGNGYVLESVNDVLRVFDTAGNPLGGVVDLNTFYGYIAQIDRATGVQGPFVTDPSCYFDPDVQRWFQVVLTLDVFPDGDNAGAFTGTSHIDIAVSKTASPLGSWNIYRLASQDDGTDGTPDHNCNPGPGSEVATNPDACFGDFPHIGADANAFFVTTNEYDVFGPEFHAAQIYAISKRALAAGAHNVNVVQFDTIGAIGDEPGFTIWPAISPKGEFAKDAGGTEFFLSSNAAEEAQGEDFTGFSNEIILWAVSNTASLDGRPNLALDNKVLPSLVYGQPPLSEQKPGPFPLGQCINDTTLVTPFGPGCWQMIFVAEPAHNEVISHLDSSDTRMMQTWYANGNIFGSLDTVVKVNGKEKAGIAYFSVKPEITHEGRGTSPVLKGAIKNQGYLAVANNNVTYPAIATLPNGKGVMAFTLVGSNFYPSAAYTSFDKEQGTGDVHIAAKGLGVSDGFSGYKAFGDPPRPRWGDYGAAMLDGKSIWIASEYIGQSCTLAQYTAGVSATSAGAFGSCGGTRTSLANWGTRISQVKP